VSNRSFIAVLAAIAFIALLAFGLIAKQGANIAVGEPAPDAPMPQLDGDGTTSIADFRGRWVLVNFWASWCKPCEQESPAIERFARKRRGELVVLGINSEDNSVDANAFIDEYGLTWDMVKDTGDRSDAYGVLGFPESFLVDPEGNLALIRRGPMDESFLNGQIAPLVDGSGEAQ
jgi:cytochrome c biogenesis protein CcmG/thiol:disulfide interchange protein DsbE